MRLACSRVKTFSDNHAIAHNHTTDPGIGRWHKHHLASQVDGLVVLGVAHAGALLDVGADVAGLVRDGACEGDDVVASGYPKFEGGRVHINKDQYFKDVPRIAWDFYIGGYQPAQKWLKDRRRRSLSWDDIGHYQKIVKILAETDRIMREIELPLHA